MSLISLMGIAQENENYSLEGTLDAFKNSNNLEEFEKAINSESNNINNLDLNNDGSIDYIQVTDLFEKNSHAIVLTAVLGENEKQDIAVIGIEKSSENEAQLQIEGDEEIFGKDVIVEPFNINEENPNGKGPNIFDTNPTRVFVNVWGWPCVRFIYAPTYVVWVSPFRWGLHPMWWKPWKPIKTTIFVSRCVVHRNHFHRTPHRNVVIARKVYTPRRNHSTVVVKSRRGSTVIHKGPRGKTTIHRKRR